MPYQTYNVLAALNRMLESKERKEASRAQHALRIMQFAQAKKAQDFEIAGKQIGYLSEVNTQMMVSQANEFLNDTGLAALYQEHKDSKTGASDAAGQLTKKRGDSWGQSIYGAEMDITDANKFISAIWSANAGNPAAILELADDLGVIVDAQQKGEELPTAATEFIKSFTNMGYGDEEDMKKVRNMQKTMKDQGDIRAELAELGKGDVEIQRMGIGIYDQAAPVAADDDKLQQLINKFKSLKGPSKGKGTDVDVISGKYHTAKEAQEALDLLPLSERYKKNVEKALDDLNNDILLIEDQLAVKQSIVTNKIKKLEEFEAQRSANKMAIKMMVSKATAPWWDVGTPQSISEDYPEKREQWQDLVKDNYSLNREILGLTRERDAREYLDSSIEKGYDEGDILGSRRLRFTTTHAIAELRKSLDDLYKRRDTIIAD